jgi:hypothetical protein
MYTLPRLRYTHTGMPISFKYFNLSYQEHAVLTAFRNNCRAFFLHGSPFRHSSLD